MLRTPARRSTLTVFVVVAVVGGCSPERLRPGPPRVTIEVREGSTVLSPDTLPVLVIASDPNRLDSLIVSFLGESRSVDTGFDVEVISVLEWAVPEGLIPGQLLTIFARARDLTGQVTAVQATVTVIAPPVAQKALTGFR